MRFWPNRVRRPIRRRAGKSVVIHDPCAIRHEIPVHDAVRTLVRNQGFSGGVMPHHGTEDPLLRRRRGRWLAAPELAGQWGQKRRAETEDRELVTYCVGCSNFLEN